MTSDNPTSVDTLLEAHELQSYSYDFEEQAWDKIAQAWPWYSAARSVRATCEGALRRLSRRAGGGSSTSLRPMQRAPPLTAPRFSRVGSALLGSRGLDVCANKGGRWCARSKELALACCPTPVDSGPLARARVARWVPHRVMSNADSTLRARGTLPDRPDRVIPIHQLIQLLYNILLYNRLYSVHALSLTGCVMYHNVYAYTAYTAYIQRIHRIHYTALYSAIQHIHYTSLYTPPLQPH
jgi:hypothetical protein